MDEFDYRDEHGQIPMFINRKRVAARTTDELIGICKGLVADNVVNGAEAEFLATWLEANRGLAVQYPVDILMARMDGMLADGRIDIGRNAPNFAIC